MRNLLREDGIANRVMMRRTHHPSAAFLLVEGDDDGKLYPRFVDEACCQIQVGYGKPVVLGAIAILEKNNVAGVLAIVDADFDHLEHRRHENPNVLSTDFHDAETSLLNSSALEDALREFGASDRPTGLAPIVRDQLYACAETLGYLRWNSEREAWKLRFEGLPYSEFVSEKALTVDDAVLFSVVRAHQSGRVGSPPLTEVVTAKVSALRQGEHDRRHVCNGHDLVAILCIGLRRLWGTNKPSDVSEERVVLALRLGWDQHEFQATTLHASIRAWEVGNAPFRILRSSDAKSAG